MLTIDAITKSFGGVHALRSCSMHIKPQSVTALIGPNGAGKTTLLDVVSGLVEPDEGRILFNATDITRFSAAQRSACGLSRTWQQVRLFQYLTIADHLRMAESGDDTKLWRNILSIPPLERRRYQSELERFGIDRPLETLVCDLSYGQRKLLQIAMAVLQPHTMLLLDEPIAGVNSVIQQRIEELLPQWKAQGETIVVIEHNMEFVQKLADHVVVMHQGTVLLEGPPSVALRDPRVLEAYLGE